MARNPKKYIQGKIEIKDLTNPHKYKTANTTNPHIVFRSSWEKSFINYLCRNPNVLEWSSEEIQITYTSKIDNRPHRYFPDFWMKVKTENNQIKEFLVEIKPFKECQSPQEVITSGMSDRTKQDIIETYVKNQAKWEAATKYCKVKGMAGFKVLTEADILYCKKHLKTLQP